MERKKLVSSSVYLFLFLTTLLFSSFFCVDGFRLRQLQDAIDEALDLGEITKSCFGVDKISDVPSIIPATLQNNANCCACRIGVKIALTAAPISETKVRLVSRAINYVLKHKLFKINSPSRFVLENRKNLFEPILNEINNLVSKAESFISDLICKNVTKLCVPTSSPFASVSFLPNVTLSRTKSPILVSSPSSTPAAGQFPAFPAEPGVPKLAVERSVYYASSDCSGPTYHINWGLDGPCDPTHYTPRCSSFAFSTSVFKTCAAAVPSAPSHGWAIVGVHAPNCSALCPGYDAYPLNFCVPGPLGMSSFFTCKGSGSTLGYTQKDFSDSHCRVGSQTSIKTFSSCFSEGINGVGTFTCDTA